jgi:hypothetical protein
VLRLLVICMCCHTLKIWDLRYRADARELEKAKCINSIGRCRVSASPCAYSDLVRLAPTIPTYYLLLSFYVRNVTRENSDMSRVKHSMLVPGRSLEMMAEFSHVMDHAD